jgi:acyl-CoA thioesterase I
MTTPHSHLQRIAALLKSDQPSRWVFAGDSITHGALHTLGWRDYTEIFSERLRWEMARVRDCVIKTGVSGWTIQAISDDLEWSVLQHRPHVVSINVGMNDCVRTPGGVEQFRRVYLDVLARIRASGGAGDAALILHTPNRVLPGDEGRAKALPPYVEAIRQIASETGAVLVDHYAYWEPFEKDTMYLWMSDPVHPLGIGHAAMAHALFKALEIFDPKSLVCKAYVP